MLRVLGGPKRFCDGMTRRELLQVGSLGWPGSLLFRSGSSARGETEPDTLRRTPAGVRSGQVVHPPLHVRLAQPARDVRPQARCPAGDPRRARLHPVERPGPERLRPAAAAVAGHGQGRAHPIGHRIPIRSTASPTRPRESRGSRSRWSSTRTIRPLAVHRLGRRLRRRRTGRQGQGRDRPSRATWSFPGRSAVSGSARCRAPVRTAGSSAGRMTRSAPSSSARRRRSREDPRRARSGKTSSRIAGSRPRAGFSSARSTNLEPRS